MSNLRTIQQQFKSEIRENRGALAGSLQEDATYTAERRLRVYRHAINNRMKEILSQDFTFLEEHFGPKKFLPWIDQYLAETPSIWQNISEISSGFANFLALHQEPFAADMARFEWELELSTLFPAPDSEIRPISALDPSRILRDTLILAPCVRLYRSDFYIPESAEPKPVHLILMDGGWEESDPVFFSLLQEISLGKSLSVILPKLGGLNPEALKAQFADWVKRKIIIGFREHSINDPITNRGDL